MEKPASTDSAGLLIINADDWGGWKSATDAAAACFEAGRITSVSAMVFMEDSERAAKLAKTLGVDTGLHVNLNQTFTGGNCVPVISEAHERVRKFLKRGRYAQLLYNPWLRGAFKMVFQSQVDEFCRLYGMAPSHFDGHQHMHLCANMLWDEIIPADQKVRRSFSFWPGEKSILNRAYRSWVDGKLEARHVSTEYFFSLEQCLRNDRLPRVTKLAGETSVELMTHPEKESEQQFLMSDSFKQTFGGLKLATYSQLQRVAKHEACGCSCAGH
ncbi:MAG TPA: ChbG/HpnK family deacetylase [Verrucomicrobiota bacterium]|nr:ChbG/HpnK family deacetylase [Verrucomicrobiota bacterium]